jgi:hypothetical protein
MFFSTGFMAGGGCRATDFAVSGFSAGATDFISGLLTTVPVSEIFAVFGEVGRLTAGAGDRRQLFNPVAARMIPSTARTIMSMIFRGFLMSHLIVC